MAAFVLQPELVMLCKDCLAAIVDQPRACATGPLGMPILEPCKRESSCLLYFPASIFQRYVSKTWRILTVHVRKVPRPQLDLAFNRSPAIIPNIHPAYKRGRRLLREAFIQGNMVKETCCTSAVRDAHLVVILICNPD